MLECVITGLSQELDFELNETVTYVSFRLPNGALLRAAVDEAAASVIVTLQVEAKGAPKPGVRAGPPVQPRSAAPPPEEQGPGDDFTPPSYDEFETTPNEDGTSTHVFGGQAAELPPEEAPADAALADYAEPPPPAPAPEPAGPPKQTPNSLTKPRVAKPNGRTPAPRARTVPAGVGGYPVLPNAGVDTAELTTSHNRDEDGVGSV